ncbi:hypothetical protein I316_02145 [Kwoniella heveanensis BCC8398]|uniref:Uncharacterized protein n=1 Tax=Kwoniella heveanensis BCC8398 TaxID=1296120 RepID=A0A1B9GZ14_9TREE|nr:hypothetical protein I316_02145 [Kwoniella heveanensis BCC8398]
MRFCFTSLLVSLAILSSSVVALQPGDVPLNVAVRSVNGEIKHFYEKDEIEYYNQKRAELKRQDPESDSYPVSNDGSGLKAFEGAGAGKRDLVVSVGGKRQDPESDSYPVSNDGTGLKAFKGAGSE